MNATSAIAAPTIVTDIPATELANVLMTADKNMTIEVIPQPNGLFTVKATPKASPPPPPAPAATPTAGPAAPVAAPTAVPVPKPVAPTTTVFAAFSGIANPGPESDADYLALLPLPPKSSFNVGLASAGQHRLRELLGEPIVDQHYDPEGHCKTPTNPKILQHLVLKDVGPFRVTGIDVAVESLAAILQQVSAARPRLFSMLRSNGMSCARFTKINGKIGPGVSTHAWGMALDFKIGNAKDEQGDNKVLRGSLELMPFFNAAGWYWGAGFPTEDGMHFEPSASLIELWQANGKF
jgi:hypothetical protein